MITASDFLELNKKIPIVPSGVDIKLVKILENHKIPFVGPSSFSISIFRNKWLMRSLINRAGLPVPRFIVLQRGKDNNLKIWAEKIVRVINPPWKILETNYIAKDFLSLTKGIIEGFGLYEKLLIEEYIIGRKVECQVVENFRGKEYYTFPPIEEKIFCPASFDFEIKEKIEQMAIKSHIVLNGRFYSHHHFIVSEKKRGDYKVYLLDSEYYPQNTKSLETVGFSYEGLLNHLRYLSLRKV